MKHEQIALREAYGKALAELGAKNDRIAVLDADVSGSTRTIYFAKEYPHRFFNFGIAEQNMMAAAVGMAKGGLIPFVNTFSFLTVYRAGDQLRSSIAYPRSNVKVVAAYGGLSDSFDGPTHQATADIAMVRALPNMTVLVPADATEVRKLMPIIAAYEGPVWLRLSRNPSPVIFDDQYEFKLGKAVTLAEGKDVTLISCGTVLGRVLEAAKLLQAQGIEPTIMSVATIKPLDTEAILQAARRTGAIVTCEEHNVLGGLGSAICEALADKYPVPVKRVGIPDTYADTGPYEKLLDTFGLSIEAIVSAAQAAMAMKV